jgi:hypothetical protein
VELKILIEESEEQELKNKADKLKIRVHFTKFIVGTFCFFNEKLHLGGTASNI